MGLTSFGCNEFNNEPKDPGKKMVAFPLLDAKEAFDASFVQTTKESQLFALSPHRGLGVNKSRRALCSPHADLRT